MRRIVSFMLVVVLLFCCTAYSEGLDVSSMTDEQLHKIIDLAKNELLKRELIAQEKLIIFDQDGVQLYLTGEYKFRLPYMELNAVVINNSDVTVAFSTDYKVSVNGWEVWGDPDYLGKTSPGKKHKGNFTIKIEDAEVGSFDEIEEIEFNLTLVNADTNRVISTAPTVTVHYK